MSRVVSLHFLFQLIAFSALSSFACAQTIDHQPLDAFADAWIDESHQEANIPGVIFALVHEGRIIMTKGFGLADLERKIPASADSVFRVGSVSKPITATGLLEIISTTDLERDTDLRSLLKPLQINPPLKLPLTPHHLLTHTAGFSESLFTQHKRYPQDHLTLSEYLARHLPPRFEEPGKVIAYNDHHTMLAGYVIEKKTQTQFASYMESAIFNPLGMTNTTFHQIKFSPSIENNLATSYHFNGKNFTPYPRDYVDSTPAAGMRTNANDMAQYVIHLLDKNNSSAQVQLSQQFTHHPNMAGRAYGFAEMSWKGRRVIYKDGQASGFAARLILVPELKLGFFVAINRSILGPMGAPNEAGRFSRNLTSAILGQVVTEGVQTPQTDLTEQPSNPDLNLYAGTYRNVVAARHSYEKFITLFDDVTVQHNAPNTLSIGKRVYQQKEKDYFETQDKPAYRIAFSRDGSSPAHYLFIGSGAYERIAWYGTSKNTPLFAIGFLVLFLLFSIGAIYALRKQRPNKSANFYMLSSATLKLSFLASFGVYVATLDPQEMFFGPNLALHIILGLPVIAMLIDLILALKPFGLVGERGAQGASRYLIATLYLAIAGAFALWLNYWNLLGWRYG